MNVGYAQAVITPSLDKTVFMAGFGQNRRAETIHDDLYVRALALQSESTTLVLTALDLIGFFRRDVQEIMQRVHQTHPQVQMLIASVHPHHGPDTMGIWGPDMRTRGVDEDYMRGLKEKIVATILASLADLQPATVKMTSVHVPGLAKNNRDPEILGDELTLAQFVNRDDLPFVSLFDFPCHPEVLWEHNPHVTADYVGYLRDEVQRQTGAPCIFFAGDLGGMMTPDVKDHSFAEAEFMGKKLAEEGVKALGQVQPAQVKEIGLQKRDIRARMTNPLYKMAFLFKTLPDARNQRGEIESEVNLVKIGGLWLAAVPGELLPKLGMQLKAQMKAAGAQVTGVIGLANDELGYILPVEDFKFPLNPFKPGAHYEETNSIGKGIAPAVMEGLSALLK